jgi:hypothetical protein
MLELKGIDGQLLGKIMKIWKYKPWKGTTFAQG